MAKPIPRIEQWCTRRSGGPYDPPELTSLYVSGTVHGHPRYLDGKAISTSAVVSVRGRVVTTQSGSRYRLGEPDPAFVAFLLEKGTPLDPKQPIKMKVPRG